jgi:hypothetical protein
MTCGLIDLKVFDAVAAGLAAQAIYVHLDNHVSKAMWCCSLTDGNSWFGDTYFNTTNWIRGLSYMAAHVCDSINSYLIFAYFQYLL